MFLQTLMNASQVGTTAPKPAPTQLALLSVGVWLAIPCRTMVQRVQLVCAAVYRVTPVLCIHTMRLCTCCSLCLCLNNNVWQNAFWVNVPGSFECGSREGNSLLIDFVVVCVMASHSIWTSALHIVQQFTKDSSPLYISDYILHFSTFFIYIIRYMYQEICLFMSLPCSLR